MLPKILSVAEVGQSGPRSSWSSYRQGAFVELGRVIRGAGRWLRRPVAGIVRRIERAVPEDPAIRAYLETQRPDIVLLTPLIDLGSSQIEYLRAARALHIPTGLCVWSWDHLSSKALIREAPDRVAAEIVWSGAIGDVILSLPALEAAKVKYTEVWAPRVTLPPSVEQFRHLHSGQGFKQGRDLCGHGFPPVSMT
jgi:hypothetical protein